MKIYLDLKLLEQQLHLRTLNYLNEFVDIDPIDIDIVCGTFEMRSTVKTIDCHDTFYSHHKRVEVIFSTYANSPDTLTISTVPFRRVSHLIISFENRMFTWLWNKFMKLS